MAAWVCISWMPSSPPPLLAQPPSPSISKVWRKGTSLVRGVSSSNASELVLAKARNFAHILSVASIAATMLLDGPNQAALAQVHSTENICNLASESSEDEMLKFEKSMSFPGNQPPEMRGMTAKNFDPARYSGRWFEVASLKRGFAGQGQEDCHCTQGVYEYNEADNTIQVDTFCVHGSPTGYVTGIRGRVQCIKEDEGLKEKCFLRFPTLPFIPKEPYDVIRTDYENYALVSGAKDTSFVQIYSRVPNPGEDFIVKYKQYLGTLGYDSAEIRDTPQDCPMMSMSELSSMMAYPGMQKALTNTFPDLGLVRPVQFDPFTSVFETLRKLVQLYFK